MNGEDVEQLPSAPKQTEPEPHDLLATIFVIFNIFNSGLTITPFIWHCTPIYRGTNRAGKLLNYVM